jgi:MtN3 and saliva related transmembrane protein
MLKQWPLVVSNFVCFGLSAFILVMTLLPQARKDKVAASLKGKER